MVESKLLTLTLGKSGFLILYSITSKAVVNKKKLFYISISVPHEWIVLFARWLTSSEVIIQLSSNILHAFRQAKNLWVIVLLKSYFMRRAMNGKTRQTLISALKATFPCETTGYLRLFYSNNKPHRLREHEKKNERSFLRQPEWNTFPRWL